MARIETSPAGGGAASTSRVFPAAQLLIDQPDIAQQKVLIVD